MSGRTPNATCEMCGTAYYRPPYRLMNSRFCSRACKGAARSGNFGEISEEMLAELYYEERLSMQQIADRLGCSPNRIVRLMDKYGFERRDQSEATYVYRNPDGDPFKIKLPENEDEWQLFALGVALYMGEGSKRTLGLALANSNPDIHHVFIAFLEQICGVSRSELRADVNIFDDLDVDTVEQWWANQLGLSLDQFTTAAVRESKGGNYTNKSKYGTLTLRFHNTKLKEIIDRWCELYYRKYRSRT